MKKLSALSVFALAPAFVLAQSGGGELTVFETMATNFGAIVNILIPIVVALAVLLFFWGLATFIFASGDEAAKDEGKRRMIWGIIALFVMVSIWGIIGWLGNILDIGQGGEAPVPGVSDSEGGGSSATPILNG